VYRHVCQNSPILDIHAFGDADQAEASLHPEGEEAKQIGADFGHQTEIEIGIEAWEPIMPLKFRYW